MKKKTKCYIKRMIGFIILVTIMPTLTGFVALAMEESFWWGFKLIFIFEAVIGLVIGLLFLGGHLLHGDC